MVIDHTECVFSVPVSLHDIQVIINLDLTDPGLTVAQESISYIETIPYGCSVILTVLVINLKRIFMILCSSFTCCYPSYGEYPDENKDEILWIAKSCSVKSPKILFVAKAFADICY